MKGAYVCMYINSTNASEFGAGLTICPNNGKWEACLDVYKRHCKSTSFSIWYSHGIAEKRAIKRAVKCDNFTG